MHQKLIPAFVVVHHLWLFNSWVFILLDVDTVASNTAHKALQAKSTP
jgi:hypothetical protein